MYNGVEAGGANNPRKLWSNLRPRLRAPKRWNLTDKEHRARVNWILRRYEAAADSKRQVEKEAQLGYQHLMSHLDPKTHPWPSKTYDPLFAAQVFSKLAVMADAVFSSPPIFDYAPGDKADPEGAAALTATVNYHLREIRPRQAIISGMMGRSIAGTQIDHWYWDYREHICHYWQRVSKEIDLIDPITGQPFATYVDEGRFKQVRARKIIRDSPNFKSLHITQVFPDDSCENIQDCAWIIFREVITAEEARARVVHDNWDEKAVEMAITADMPSDTRGKIGRQLDWQEEIGIRTGNYRDGLLEKSGNGERQLVEVLECWYREPFEVKREVLLNQMAICWDGPSPFAHPWYPFTKTDNYHVQGQFWGLSDYRIIRWLLRGIQSLRNAAISEAMIAAMPLTWIPENIEVRGFRFEPQAIAYHNGPPDWVPQQFQPGSVSRQIAHSEADKLQQRGEQALGTSEVASGSPNAGGQKATTVNLAMEAAGKRNGFSIGNYADEFLTGGADMTRDLVQQYQDVSVQTTLTGNPKGKPLTYYPEQFRDGDYYSIPTVSTSVYKSLREKRVGELYQRAVEAQEPNADRRALWEMYVEVTLPEAKDRIMKPLEQIQGGTMQQPGAPPIQGIPQGMPMLPQPGGGDSVHEMAGELAAQYG